MNALYNNPRSLIGLLVLFMALSPSRVSGQIENGAVHMPEFFEVPYVNISKVEITGNKRTKEKIIIRELDFKMGDSLLTMDAKSVFNVTSGQKRFVEIFLIVIVMVKTKIRMFVD